MNIFNNQELVFFARLFDESEEVTLEVLPGCTKVGVIKIPVHGDPKLYVFKNRKIYFVFYSLLTNFLFVGDKVASDSFKDLNQSTSLN